MNYYNLLQQMIGMTLIVLFLAGCGAPVATPHPIPTDTATFRPTLAPLNEKVVMEQAYSNIYQKLKDGDYVSKSNVEPERSIFLTDPNKKPFYDSHPALDPVFFDPIYGKTITYYQERESPHLLWPLAQEYKTLGFMNVFLSGTYDSFPQYARTLKVGAEGRVSAEGEVINVLVDEDQQFAGIEIEEEHYGPDGEPVFRCTSQFNNDMVKVGETNIFGTKLEEYYFLWPTTVMQTPSPIQTPTKTTVSLNLPSNPQLGDTWTSPIDGMTLVYIPPGDFLMGSADSDVNAESYEKPQHMVYLDGYWMDQMEVTEGMYAECVAAGKCQEKIYCPKEGNDHPFGCVSWDEANAYCEWAGRRLPTEAEWEKAARGTDGRIFPWGESFPTCSIANFEDCGEVSRPVGSYPAGASPYGLLDMAGNQWEWVADWYGETYYAVSPDSNPTGPSSGGSRVLRGGGWSSPVRLIRASARLWSDPRYDIYGLRCAH